MSRGPVLCDKVVNISHEIGRVGEFFGLVKWTYLFVSIIEGEGDIIVISCLSLVTKTFLRKRSVCFIIPVEFCLPRRLLVS